MPHKMGCAVASSFYTEDDMESSEVLQNAIMHEIENGTQRSVGALYGIMILFDGNNGPH